MNAERGVKGKRPLIVPRSSFIPRPIVLGKSKIKLEKDLLEKAEKYAASAGYSSVEELITHLLEKEIAKWEESEGAKEVEKRLRGLGYID